MNNKQELMHRLRGDTGRLAATYLVIIAALTIVFSTVIYTISVSQLSRPLPPRFQSGGQSQFDDFTRDSLQQLIYERAEQARQELLLSLLFLNLAVLSGGAWLSYVLARKTLAPIEAAMEAQSQFVSDASHELRTPLTALQVTNEVALRKKSLTLPQAKELIGYNLAETIKLHNLSESLLGLAKQDKADMRVEPLILNEVFTAVIDTLQPLAVQKNIKISQNLSVTSVTANRAALTQLVTILLDNAVKYSPNGSTVLLAAQRVKTNVVIEVSDCGPGIAAEHQSRIFDRFYRIDESRSSQNVEGSGLGLAIAKTIAWRHGYEVSVSNLPGKHTGAVFSIRLGQ